MQTRGVDLFDFRIRYLYRLFFFFFFVAISHTHYTTKMESSVAMVETITVDISMIGLDIPRPFSPSRDITASGYRINISKNVRSFFENMKIPLNIILH